MAKKHVKTEITDKGAKTTVHDYDTCGEWIVRAKWTIDGAKTLDEAAEMADAFAASLRQMVKDGWKLDDEIQDDYGFCSRTTKWLKSHPKEAAEIAAEQKAREEEDE